MAEFCYDCYKRVLKGDKEKRELVISRGLDLCEGCGQYKRVVVCYKNRFEMFLTNLFGR